MLRPDTTSLHRLLPLVLLLVASGHSGLGSNLPISTRQSIGGNVKLTVSADNPVNQMTPRGSATYRLQEKIKKRTGNLVDSTIQTLRHRVLPTNWPIHIIKVIQGVTPKERKYMLCPWEAVVPVMRQLLVPGARPARISDHVVWKWLLTNREPIKLEKSDTYIPERFSAKDVVDIVEAVTSDPVLVADLSVFRGSTLPGVGELTYLFAKCLPSLVYPFASSLESALHAETSTASVWLRNWVLSSHDTRGRISWPATPGLAARKLPIYQLPRAFSPEQLAGYFKLANAKPEIRPYVKWNMLQSWHVISAARLATKHGEWSNMWSGARPDLHPTPGYAAVFVDYLSDLCLSWLHHPAQQTLSEIHYTIQDGVKANIVKTAKASFPTAEMEAVQAAFRETTAPAKSLAEFLKPFQCSDELKASLLAVQLRPDIRSVVDTWIRGSV